MAARGSDDERAIEDFTERERAQVSPAWILQLLYRERRLVFLFVAVGLAIGTAIALLRQPRYSVTFSFVPQTADEQGPAGLANLAGQFGLSLTAGNGFGQSPQFYADLLETREILTPIARDTVSIGAQSMPLPAFLGVSDDNEAAEMEEAVTELREIVSSDVAARTTGVVTVTVRTAAPEASFLIAERLLGELNRFNLETRQTQAAAERRFVESRLDAAQQSLREAEDALRAFLLANRQIGPSLQFERERLERAVGMKQEVVTRLAQQYEEARIREVRDTPVLTTVERPAFPVRPDPGRRLITVLAAASTAFFAALAFVLARTATRAPETAPYPREVNRTAARRERAREAVR